jgi:hypothetical protein
MRPTSRLTLFALAVAFAAACAESSGPDGDLLESRTDTGDPNDTVGAPPPPPGNTTAPVDPGPRPDSTPTPLPPLLDRFTVVGHVFDATPGPDSAASTPIAGARVEMWKFMTADGRAVFPRVLVASAVSDAKGIFRIPDLPSAHYDGIVTGPPGGGFGQGGLQVAPQRQPEAHYWVALRRQP